jgi:hypothetical protein
MTVELAERMEWGAVKRVALLAIKQAAVDARRQSAAGIMAFDWLKSTGLEWAELVGFNLTAEKLDQWQRYGFPRCKFIEDPTFDLSLPSFTQREYRNVWGKQQNTVSAETLQARPSWPALQPERVRVVRNHGPAVLNHGYPTMYV